MQYPSHPFSPCLIFVLLRAWVCYAIKPLHSHVITMLSKWCQAVGLEWVMGVRSPSVVHDMTRAAGVQVKWTAFWQSRRAEHGNFSLENNCRRAVFAIQRAPYTCDFEHPPGGYLKCVHSTGYYCMLQSINFQSLFNLHAAILSDREEQKIRLSWNQGNRKADSGSN